MIIQVCVSVKTMKKPLNERFQELAGIKPLNELEAEGSVKEFRRTGRKYKAQGQGGSAGNRRPGMMGPRGTDQDDINPPIPDDIPSDPYEKKGGEYHNYGSMSIRFMDKDMKEVSLVVLRGYGRNKEGTYHGYIEKSMHGHFIVSFSSFL